MDRYWTECMTCDLKNLGDRVLQSKEQRFRAAMGMVDNVYHNSILSSISLQFKRKKKVLCLSPHKNASKGNYAIIYWIFGIESASLHIYEYVWCIQTRCYCFILNTFKSDTRKIRMPTNSETRRTILYYTRRIHLMSIHTKEIKNIFLCDISKINSFLYLLLFRFTLHTFLKFACEYFF